MRLSSRFRKLFGSLRVGRLELLLAVAALVQIGYWYLGSPGPSLLSNAPRTLFLALVNIGWAVTLLLAVPALTLYAVGELKGIPAGLGRWRLGLALTVPLAVAALGALYLGSSDAGLQNTYPWAGAWPGRSVPTFLSWSGLYALYYVSFEFFYRGFLLAALTPRWGLRAAVWTQVLLSTLIHIGKPLTETLAALPAGFLFAFLALKTRSLVWPTVLHLVIGLTTDAFVLQRQGLFL